MNWETIVVGAYETNCYIIYNSEKNCIVIDPGDEGNKIIEHIEKRELSPQAIILTHAHSDHIGAVDDLRSHFKIPAYIHENEAKWLLDPALNGSLMAGHTIRLKPADYFISVEGKQTVGDFSFELLETPGHTPGGISLYFEEGKFVVVGDALFQGSIGRTDFPGGNYADLIRSIHNKLLVLPGDTIVLPGHGNTTSILSEINMNPFLQGFKNN